jgi:hypothetical protein
MSLPPELAAGAAAGPSCWPAEPVEDPRLDFEDGYGDRGDDAEDADAAGAGGRAGRRRGGRVGAAVHRAAVQEPGGGHPAPGDQDAGRLSRAALLGDGPLPPGFTVTPAQGHPGRASVEAMSHLCRWLEEEHRLARDG